MGVSIEIDGWDPLRKYYGGDIIRGIVAFINDGSQSKTFTQDVVIKFKGKAESHWKEQRKNVNHYRQYLVTTFDTEVYFDEVVTLQNLDMSVDNRELKPGRTEFPFLFQLPQGIPESYKSEHGSVSYVIEVPYPKSWNPNYDEKLEFLVGAHLDLNLLQIEWTQPAQFVMEKDIWWGGKVEAHLSVCRKAFVPLEDINFTLEIINKSRCYLKKIRVYFCQVTTYKSKGSEYREGSRLSKIKCKPVHSQGTATIQGSIAVPEAIPPTELGGCDLVQPQYGIMIKVIATTFGKLLKSSVLEGRVPLIIGTVPLGTTIGVPPPDATLIRPITALRRGLGGLQLTEESDHRMRKLVLTSEQPEDEGFANLAGGEGE